MSKHGPYIEVGDDAFYINEKSLAKNSPVFLGKTPKCDCGKSMKDAEFDIEDNDDRPSRLIVACGKPKCRCWYRVYSE